MLSLSGLYLSLHLTLCLCYLFLQKAGQGGGAGQRAARNVAAESRSAAGAASPRTACARAQLKKAGPATLRPALVSPPAR